MPLIAKNNGRFRGKWTYAVPQEQHRTPAPSRKIQLARLAIEKPAEPGSERNVTGAQRAALQ